VSWLQTEWPWSPSATALENHGQNRSTLIYFGALPPDVSGDVVDVPLVLWSDGGGVVAFGSVEPGAVASGLVVDESGDVLGGIVEASGDVVLGSVVVWSAGGAFGAVEFCFVQAAVNASAPRQSRRTLRFIMILSLRL
jgi:hypothetical protein